MTTRFRSNPLAKLLDSIFDDKCLYRKSGSVERGPGVICGLYIFLLITGCIVNIIISQSFIKYGVSRQSIIIQNIIDIVILLFSIYFMYHMCYICRGFVGFITLVLIMAFVGFIRWHIFSNYQQKTFKGVVRDIKNKN